MHSCENAGNLFDSSAPALAHGVNTVGLMGAGIAVEFRRRWPQMYQAYRKCCSNEASEIERLRPGGMMPWATFKSTPKWIFNIASQDNPGRNAKLEWLEEGLVQSLKFAQEAFGVDRIAMPRIGCGIGGLRWSDVREILDHYATASTIDIEVWSPPEWINARVTRPTHPRTLTGETQREFLAVA